MAQKVPEEAKEMFDQNTFDKSRVYQLDKSSFAMAKELYQQLEFLVCLPLPLPLSLSLSLSIADVICVFCR